MDKAKSNLRKKLRIILAVALIIYMGAALYAFISLSELDNLDTRELTYNKVRVLVNGILHDIENNYSKIIGDHDDNEHRDVILSKLEGIDGKLEVIGLDGRVYFHWAEENIHDAEVFRDIRTYIQYDSSYSIQNEQYLKFSFPIIYNGQQRLIAVFELPKALFYEDIAGKDFYFFIPIFIVLLLAFMIMVYFFIKINKGVLNPLQKLSSSVKEIGRGNLDSPIYISSGTEIDEFCRDFDFMRQELKDAKAKQKELENAQKELIASISHELQTPVSCIKANVEGILDGIVTNEEMMKRYLNAIKERSDSLSKLINDLLIHSMQQLQKLKIEKRECYSKQLFERVHRQLYSRFDQTKVSFQVEADIPDVLINVDEGRIEQVILNLVQNAEKYAPEDAKITLRYSLEDQHIWISIIDNGFGIAPEELPHIFEKFYRGEKTREKVMGAGLGLSICKYIVEQHGGTIKAKSTENHGSEFVFSIPIV